MGCPVYIRRIGRLWEYLTVIKGLIYTNNVEIKPGMFRKDYTEEEILSARKFLLALAMANIEKAFEKPKFDKPKKLAIGEKDVNKIREEI